MQGYHSFCICSEGAVSYPAALDCVIGIDGLRLNRNIKGFWRCGAGTYNYIKSMKEKHLPWLNNKMKTVSGTSFIAPEFTALLLQCYKKSNFLSEIVAAFNEMASGEIDD